MEVCFHIQWNGSNAFLSSPIPLSPAGRPSLYYTLSLSISLLFSCLSSSPLIHKLKHCLSSPSPSLCPWESNEEEKSLLNFSWVSVSPGSLEALSRFPVRTWSCLLTCLCVCVFNCKMTSGSADKACVSWYRGSGGPVLLITEYNSVFPGSPPSFQSGDSGSPRNSFSPVFSSLITKKESKYECVRKIGLTLCDLQPLFTTRGSHTAGKHIKYK